MRFMVICLWIALTCSLPRKHRFIQAVRIAASTGYSVAMAILTGVIASGLVSISIELANNYRHNRQRFVVLSAIVNDLRFLNEISFFSADPEEHQENVKKAHTELDQAMEEVKAGHTIPAEQVFRELAEEHGFPVDEKDEYMDELRSEIRAAQYKYSRYCHWRERSRILESIGEAAVRFEEAEMRWEQGEAEYQ